ncbi:hypothetical protein ACOME3_002881 [Neoechinorhynchus agilis]
MIEFGVLKDHRDELGHSPFPIGVRPLMMFRGDLFQTYKHLRSLFIQLIDTGDQHRPKELVMNAQNTRSVPVISFFAYTSENGKPLVSIRSYVFDLAEKKTSRPVYPAIDLEVRRTFWSSQEVYRKATRRPLEVVPVKRKNVRINEFGHKIGRVYLGRQDAHNIEIRRTAGLKSARKWTKKDKQSFVKKENMDESE